MNTVTEEEEEQSENTPVKVVRAMPFKQPKKNLLIQAHQQNLARGPMARSSTTKFTTQRSQMPESSFEDSDFISQSFLQEEEAKKKEKKKEEKIEEFQTRKNLNLKRIQTLSQSMEIDEEELRKMTSVELHQIMKHKSTS